MESQTIGFRLREARKRARFTLEEVGRNFGLSAQAVQQWEKDRTVPEPNRLQAVATLLGVSVQWIITGAGLPEHTGNDSLRPIHHMRGRSVPRYSMLQAALVKHIPNAATFITSHFPCSAQSFAFTIEDASNAPEFTPGDSVVIDPSLEFRPGDMVFAVLGECRLPVFRRIRVVSASAHRYTLVSLNDLWGNDELTIPAEGQILGVMSEHTRPRR